MIVIVLSVSVTIAKGGPYNEAGINGYIGDDWRHANPFEDPDAVLNPIFRGWADAVESYQPAPGVEAVWQNASKALGPATGDHYYGVVGLGDLDEEQIGQGTPPGQITLSFNEPGNIIRDVNGYDFVVFENGFISGFTDPVFGFVEGQIFAELGYVEVSSDGNNFVRFSGVSLTAGRVGALGTIDISDVYNFAGKHPNGYGLCTGTAFDLSDIEDDPSVVSGLVDVNNIRYVRIVDIPGSGDFYDEAVKRIDPGTWPVWANYDANHPVYDVWLTLGSGGVDLEAIGVLCEQKYSGDVNLDGIVDVYDFLAFSSAWLSRFGTDNWIARCDVAEPKDMVIDFLDFAVLAEQWGAVEDWRNQ